MRAGTTRHPEHYEIAAYGRSAVLWGYNPFKSNAILILDPSDFALVNLGRTTESDILSGWGTARGIFDVLNERSRADQRCRSGRDVPILEMFGFASTPWARLCYGKKWLTQKLTGFKKKYVIKSIRRLMDTHRSDFFKIDPLSFGGPSWWTLSEFPPLFNRNPLFKPVMETNHEKNIPTVLLRVSTLLKWVQ